MKIEDVEFSSSGAATVLATATLALGKPMVHSTIGISTCTPCEVSLPTSHG